MRCFVVVSGLPGSGKTTVGRALARVRGLEVLDKDDILEALFDSLGVGDASWRRKLSRTADETLERLAARSSGAVLISFWRHASATAESGTPTGWLSKLPGTVTEVHCRCEPAIAVERFANRTRHRGHLDHQRDRAKLLTEFEALAKRGPIIECAAIEIDTTSSVDIRRLAQQVALHVQARAAEV